MTIKKPKNLGATGKFPQGKVEPADEGELKFAVAHDDRKRLVRVEFGTPVAWIAMPPEAAMQFATALNNHAMACMRGANLQPGAHYSATSRTEGGPDADDD